MLVLVWGKVGAFLGFLIIGLRIYSHLLVLLAGLLYAVSFDGLCLGYFVVLL